MARENRSSDSRRESRRTSHNLINEILSMKPLAFGSGVDKIDLIDWLRDRADNVRSGQKRIVIDNPENKDEVIKISYSIDGLYDNMNDVICYNTLLDLEYNGDITADDLKLFNNAELLNDDPMIIVETAQITYRDCREFEDWLDRNRDDYRDMKKADLWAVFISFVDSLREDYNRIQKILADYFIPSDGTLTLEPDNYGVWREGNSLRLIFYDMGSVVPILDNRRPLCPECGDELKYVNIELSSSKRLSHDVAETLEGIYGCRNENCTFSRRTIYKKSSGIGKVRDSRVYAEYCDKNQKYLDDLYASECNFYIPEYRLYSFDKYVRDYEDVFRGSKKKEKEYKIMYQNYLCYEIGGVFQGLGADLEDLKEKTYAKELSYNSFIDSYDDLIEDVLDVDRTKITDLAGVVAFISAISDDTVAIQEIFNAEDLRDFEDIVDSKSKVKLSTKEIDSLWDTLEPMLATTSRR